MVDKIKDPIILGMPFFIEQRSVLNFPTAELELPTGNLSCVTKDGHPSEVRVVNHQVECLPPHSEVVVLRKIRGEPQTCRRVGIVEGGTGVPQVAASLTYLDHEGKVWIRVMNSTACPQPPCWHRDRVVSRNRRRGCHDCLGIY